ncbi:hypothetical protein ACFLRQ_01250 [Bacteroidota bacterium]
MFKTFYYQTIFSLIYRPITIPEITSIFNFRRCRKKCRVRPADGAEEGADACGSAEGGADACGGAEEGADACGGAEEGADACGGAEEGAKPTRYFVCLQCGS